MKKIYLYTGTGAYQAKDLENFFTVFNIDYRRLCEHDLNQLTPPDIFVVPGGQIKAIPQAWGEDGMQIIRNFVQAGGTYLGICAGTYISGQNFEGQKTLGLVGVEFPYQTGQKTIPARDLAGHQIELIAENAPNLNLIKNADPILLNNDQQLAVKLNYGEGQVYLFAAHPEGSLYYNAPPQNFSGAQFFKKFLEQIKVG